jgi:hypothetical protein
MDEKFLSDKILDANCDREYFIDAAKMLKDQGEHLNVMKFQHSYVVGQLTEAQSQIKKLRAQLKDATARLMDLPLKDAQRYQWLRTEFAAGRETYLAEGIPSGEKLDQYIDNHLEKK